MEQSHEDATHSYHNEIWKLNLGLAVIYNNFTCKGLTLNIILNYAVLLKYQQTKQSAITVLYSTQSSSESSVGIS